MTKTTWDGLPIASDWPTGAAVVVFRRASTGLELLVLHRAHSGPEYEGDWAWTPPTGARFPGEDVLVCAARELHEEAGLSLPMTRLDEGESWARFVAEAPLDVVVTMHDAEHDRYEWVAPEVALSRVAPETVRDGLRKALDWIDGQVLPADPEAEATA
ncbi:NUDIX domain-containing protein [Tenggerimyces flavus]|uniref:NUDIX domain-containing protein n=1 Tax=Tenggerimyces flavus TaxID=1708749 RepID=A0ABV7YDR2_9ACTN|nr:NUDIX domain-containing protein [Tenggerimyces flavus]MBM7786089.1 8-oxo-dGTP pyrophosphatase MutT (NUDIX family) [Tenggerimyces flavus]